MQRFFVFKRGILLAALIVLLPTVSWAHGVVGKRLFVEPIATEDANVFSEFDLIVPSYVKGPEGNELELGSSFTIRLTENMGMEIAGSWVSLDPKEGSSETGMANPEVSLKYAAIVSPEHEWIFTPAVSVEPPLGREEIGAEQIWGFGTGVFFGKGFGDLPDALGFLQPFMVQGDVSVNHALTRHEDDVFNTLSYDIAMYYSLPYLQQFVKDIGIPWPLNRMFPMVELNYERVLNGPEVDHIDATARPGILFVGKSMEIGVAAVLPASSSTRDEMDWGVTGIVSLFLDDLMPNTLRDGILMPSMK